MQLKNAQKFDGGAVMNEPPQNVYPHGLAAAPHVFATGGWVAGGAVGGAGVGATVTGARVSVGAPAISAVAAGATGVD